MFRASLFVCVAALLAWQLASLPAAVSAPAEESPGLQASDPRPPIVGFDSAYDVRLATQPRRRVGIVVAELFTAADKPAWGFFTIALAVFYCVWLVLQRGLQTIVLP